MSDENGREQSDSLRNLELLCRLLQGWPDKFLHLLSHVRTHPEHVNKIGLYVVDIDEIAANATILGEFLRVKPNSVRKALREHQFSKRGRVPCDLRFNFQNRRYWNIHEAQGDLFGANAKEVLAFKRRSVSGENRNGWTVDESEFEWAEGFD
jgi:hypothetical protein